MSTEMTPRDRLDDLLAQLATEGMDHAERYELVRLLEKFPDADLDGWERAAAAIDLASAPAAKTLPAALAEKLLAEARTHAARVAVGLEESSVVSIRPPKSAVSRAGRGRLAWLAAAAAAAIAIWGWLPRLLPPPPEPAETVAVEPSIPPVPVAPPSAAELRADMLLEDANSRSIDWAATEDPAAAAAQGDVVWSQRLQQGYMRFRGLAANDPAVSQYQLWIFDAERDERYPVDGGVFDVGDAGTETVVPIAARLPVGQPTLFAVTVEKPGGTVVSDRERIVVVAALN